MDRSISFMALALVIGLSIGLTSGLLINPGPRIEQVTKTMEVTKTLEVTRTGPTVLLTATATITTAHTLTLTSTETTTIIPETPPLYNQSGVAVCFSEPMNCRTMLETFIYMAEKRVLVAVYSFTDDRLADALIAVHNRGIEVKVLLEAETAGIKGSEYERLKNAGVDVRLDGNPGLMHHKFMVVDDVIVVTGSYNWSRAAEESNDENVVAILSEDVAKLFADEFERMWALSTG